MPRVSSLIYNSPNAKRKSLRQDTALRFTCTLNKKRTSQDPQVPLHSHVPAEGGRMFFQLYPRRKAKHEARGTLQTPVEPPLDSWAVWAASRRVEDRRTPGHVRTSSWIFYTAITTHMCARQPGATTCADVSTKNYDSRAAQNANHAAHHTGHARPKDRRDSAHPNAHRIAETSHGMHTQRRMRRRDKSPARASRSQSA